MLIQDRLKLIMQANRLNATEFAERVGVNRASLSHVLGGRNKPSMDFLSKVIKEFPNVNGSWLLTGEANNENSSMQNENVQLDMGKDSIEENSSSIERVIVFYKNGTCKEYSIT